MGRFAAVVPLEREYNLNVPALILLNGDFPQLLFTHIAAPAQVSSWHERDEETASNYFCLSRQSGLDPDIARYSVDDPSRTSKPHCSDAVLAISTVRTGPLRKISCIGHA